MVQFGRRGKRGVEEIVEKGGEERQQVESFSKMV